MEKERQEEGVGGDDKTKDKDKTKKENISKVVQGGENTGRT